MTKTLSSRLLVGTTAVIMLLAGCSNNNSVPENSSAPEAPNPSNNPGTELLSTVDTMFGEIEIPAPSDGDLTVVALGWSDAEAALALGVKPVAVYDWMGFGPENNGVGPWATALFGDDAPVVMANTGEGEVDYELIQSFNPDLILNTNAGGDEAQFKRLNEIAPTVFGPTGSEGWTTGWRRQTQQVATALGQSAAGEKLIAETEQLIADAAVANPEFAKLTAVTGSKFGDAYGASLTGDFRWDFMADLGFQLHPAVAALPATGFFAPVSLEQIGVFEADVAVLFPIGYTLAELRADPLINALQVVQEGRAVFLDPTEPLVNSFSVASVLSIPYTVENLTPLLKEAAAKAKQ